MEQAENETLEPIEELQELDEVQDEGVESLESEDAPADEDDEVVVTIGEESPPQEEEQKAPEWVRELRKSNREKDRELRELRDFKAKANAPTDTAQTVLGAKPTLEGAEYDTDKFEQQLEAWHDRKRSVESEAKAKQEAANTAQAEWQSKLDGYNKLKGELKVLDFEDAEEVIQNTLSVTQQGVILQGSKNPALLVYALGKNPKKAQELSAIKDPVKFAFAAAELESQLKVTPRKSAPLPETRVRGSAPSSGAVDNNLDRLRAAAEKTGDMSAVIAYRQKLRAKT